MNAVLDFLSEFSVIFILLAVFIYLIVLIIYINKMKDNKDREASLMEEYDMLSQNSGQKEIKKTIPMLSIEKDIYSSLGVQENSTFIFLIRIGVCGGIIALGFALKLLAIFIAFEIVMILKTNVEDKRMEDEIGISRTEMINKFLDFYIPSVQSGTSVRQTMQTFIANHGDKDLVEWFYSTDKNKVIPKQWEEIINTYENGIASEEAGMVDKAELYQEEIDRMMIYFNNFKSKIGEVNPICYCYYIGVPVVSFMSYSNLPEFWGGFGGGVCIFIMCVLFFAFNRLIQKTKRDAVEKIF